MSQPGANSYLKRSALERPTCIHRRCVAPVSRGDGRLMRAESLTSCGGSSEPKQLSARRPCRRQNVHSGFARAACLISFRTWISANVSSSKTSFMKGGEMPRRPIESDYPTSDSCFATVLVDTARSDPDQVTNFPEVMPTSRRRRDESVIDGACPVGRSNLQSLSSENSVRSNDLRSCPPGLVDQVAGRKGD
jgi:hypothetical protein